LIQYKTPGHGFVHHLVRSAADTRSSKPRSGAACTGAVLLQPVITCTGVAVHASFMGSNNHDVGMYRQAYVSLLYAAC
jgi:hypothetical protein